MKVVANQICKFYRKKMVHKEENQTIRVCPLWYWPFIIHMPCMLEICHIHLNNKFWFLKLQILSYLSPFNCQVCIIYRLWIQNTNSKITGCPTRIEEKQVIITERYPFGKSSCCKSLFLCFQLLVITGLLRVTTLSVEQCFGEL